MTRINANGAHEICDPKLRTGNEEPRTWEDGETAEDGTVHGHDSLVAEDECHFLLRAEHRDHVVGPLAERRGFDDRAHAVTELRPGWRLIGDRVSVCSRGR